MLSNNFAFIFSRPFYGLDCFVQLRIECLTNSIDWLKPRSAKCVLETRSRSPYAFGNIFSRATCFGGFGCALEIVEHGQQGGNEICLLKLGSLVSGAVQTLPGFVSLALKLFPQLLKTRLHLLSLLLRGPRARLEFFHITGLETWRFNNRIAVGVLVIVQLQPSPIRHANFRVVISPALVISAEKVFSHAIPLLRQYRLR